LQMCKHYAELYSTETLDSFVILFRLHLHVVDILGSLSFKVG